MDRIDLPSPVPRAIELPYENFPYSIKETTQLPEPDVNDGKSFIKVLSSRRSRRAFRKISLERLSALLWHSARSLEGFPPERPLWQHRPAPSAGGCHPVDILLVHQDWPQQILLYEPTDHSLSTLKIVADAERTQFIKLADQVIPIGEATILWFGAQFDKTLSRYENGESLVWRDAGALIATISLVAEFLQLNSCALGITGEPYFSQMLDSRGKVVGVGGLLVGDRNVS
jgi:SagB-type dehydrogenase family enzyme